MTSTISRAMRTTTSLCAIISLAACSTAGGLVHPQIGPIDYSPEYNGFTADSYTDDSIYKTLAIDIGEAPISNADSLRLGLAKAEQLDAQLYNAMWWNDTYGFATGVGMFAAGIATLAFGVFDASRTLLLGGGLATATLGGVRTFYPFADRNELYSAGRVAVQCAVQSAMLATEFHSKTKPEPVDGDVTAASGEADPGDLSLDAILNRAEAAAALLQQVAAGLRDPRERDVGIAVDNALFINAASTSAATLMDAVANGRAVQSDLQADARGVTLLTAISKIQVLVDAQADALRPDPEAALRVARDELNANLTAVRERALQAREQARLADNNRPKAQPGTKAAQPVDAAIATAATGAAPAPVADDKGATENVTPAEATQTVAKAAQQLAARMATIARNFSTISSCTSIIGNPGA